MERTERTVAELAALLRMIQVIPDADSIGRVYEILLALCTAWRTVGFDRAVLLLVDPRDRTVRGRMACERRTAPVDPAGAHDSFEAMAREVFDAAEALGGSEATLRAQAFTVGLDWTRCGVVKAVTSGHPVLADRSMSEFATDPYFDAFDVGCYLAVPLRVHGRILAVLAADHGGGPIAVDNVSLVSSLVHQAALAVERIMDDAESRRTLRVLRKVQTMLRDAATEEALAEALNLVLTMAARSIGGSGALLRDFVRNRTLHIRTVDEYTVEADASDQAVGDAMEAVLDRCAGTQRPVHGDAGHPLLSRAGVTTVSSFYATPLLGGGDGLGALVVYADAGGPERVSARRRTIVDLCAGMVAARLDALQRTRRLERAETVLEEVRSNLVRERDASRAGEHALEYARALREELSHVGQALEAPEAAGALSRAREALAHAQAVAREHEARIETLRAALSMVDVFALVREVADPWARALRERDVDVTVRIPRRGEWLLMHRPSVRRAVEAILRVVSASVLEHDRVLLECSSRDGRVVLLVADTGPGMPGDLLGRLLMPFAGEDEAGERGAMSVAGDILRRHGGEITVRSSPSWRTILVVSFPRAANRDRRRASGDRRRRGERRRGSPEAPDAAARTT